MKFPEIKPLHVFAVAGVLLVGLGAASFTDVRLGSVVGQQEGDVVERSEIQLPESQPSDRSFQFNDFAEPFPTKARQGEEITAKLGPQPVNTFSSLDGNWVAYIDVEDSPSMIKLDEGEFSYSDGSSPLIDVKGTIPVKPDVKPPENLPEFNQDLIGTHHVVVYANAEYSTGETAYITDSIGFGQPTPFKSTITIDEALDSDGDGIADVNDECPNEPGVEENNGCPFDDSDSDGVIDPNDECSGTPEGADVNQVGCAIDTDNDGVADYKDECSGTPEEASADDTGCAVDSDGDGVADYNDQCPNTGESPLGIDDSTGCPFGDKDADGIKDEVDECPNTFGTKENGCPTIIDQIINTLGLRGLF